MHWICVIIRYILILDIFQFEKNDLKLMEVCYWFSRSNDTITYLCMQTCPSIYQVMCFHSWEVCYGYFLRLVSFWTFLSKRVEPLSHATSNVLVLFHCNHDRQHCVLTFLKIFPNLIGQEILLIWRQKRTISALLTSYIFKNLHLFIVPHYFSYV